jgi:hypothetical protein
MSAHPSPADRALLRFLYCGTTVPNRWLRIIAVRITRDLVRRRMAFR